MNQSNGHARRATEALFLCVLMGVAPSCKREGAASASTNTSVPVVRATVVDVRERPMPRHLELTGQLTPDEASDVAANTTGAVAETMVERGSFVDKGAIVARIDARNAALSAAEAKANAESAKTSLELAKNECERLEKLYKAGAITGVDYDRQRSQCDSAHWSSAAAQVRVATAQKGLLDTNVRAPFRGMIAERLVTAGEYVQPNTKVVRVVAIDPMRLELTVPEANVGVLHIGLPVEFSVSAFPGQTFRGTVRYLGPALRTASRDLVVEAVIPNSDVKLRPGMFASARLDLGEQSTLAIPSSAIRKEGSLNHVFVALPSGIAQERLVSLSEPKDDYVAVEGGLKAGEKVVAPVTSEVVDGVRIQ